MGCLRWTRTRASGPEIAAGIRRPSVTPIVPSARRKAGTGGNGAGLAKRTRTCAGLHRSGRRRRSCDDDASRRGLDATRRLPIRRCCCSPRGMPSARGASPRSCVARCRRLPTETWVGSVSRLLAKRAQDLIWLHPSAAWRRHSGYRGSERVVIGGGMGYRDACARGSVGYSAMRSPVRRCVGVAGRR